MADPRREPESETEEPAGPLEILKRISEKGLVEYLAEHIEARLGEPVFQRDTAFLETLLPMMDLFASWFDAEVRGLERVPETGGVLLVGNHSGGLWVPDTSAFIAAWYHRFGLERALLGLAFDAMFGIPGVDALMRRIGQIPAHPDHAGAALDAGAAVLVYPGGAHEAFRPWSERNRIDFAGHKGFVKLALRKQVPVVPVVGHGGHESTLVLGRADWIAERLGMQRLRVSVLPLVWQIPWGLSLPLPPGVPLPAKITVDVGEPIDWRHLGPEAADDPALVDRCYEEITQAMQATLSRLAAERPYPLLDRVWGALPKLL